MYSAHNEPLVVLTTCALLPTSSSNLVPGAWHLVCVRLDGTFWDAVQSEDTALSRSLSVGLSAAAKNARRRYQCVAPHRLHLASSHTPGAPRHIIRIHRMLHAVGYLQRRIEDANARAGPDGRRAALGAAFLLVLLLARRLGRKSLRLVTLATAVVHPIYGTLKALDAPNATRDELQRRWLAYWLCLGLAVRARASADCTHVFLHPCSRVYVDCVCAHVCVRVFVRACLQYQAPLEGTVDMWLSLLPNYSFVKLSALVWLQNKGSMILYALALKVLLAFSPSCSPFLCMLAIVCVLAIKMASLQYALHCPGY